MHIGLHVHIHVRIHTMRIHILKVHYWRNLHEILQLQASGGQRPPDPQ